MCRKIKKVKLKPQKIVESFKRRPDSIVAWLRRHGFRKIGHGAFADVFSHSNVDYVVKVGDEFESPPRSRRVLKPIARVNLNIDEYPRDTRNEYPFALLIQPKCEVFKGYDEDSADFDRWDAMCEKLKQYVGDWDDYHPWNIGVYKGKPVIIDW